MAGRTPRGEPGGPTGLVAAAAGWGGESLRGEADRDQRTFNRPTYPSIYFMVFVSYGSSENISVEKLVFFFKEKFQIFNWCRCKKTP